MSSKIAVAPASETNRSHNTIFSDPGARCTCPFEKSGLAPESSASKTVVDPTASPAHQPEPYHIDATASVAFGRFRVSPHRRELLADGRPVKLGGRAFDVLMALIEACGAVIAKDALMARVWPDRIVEEKNLHVHLSALRKAFGADRDLIRTVSGRGYQFTGEIRILSASPVERIGAGVAAAKLGSVLWPTNLPEPISELMGRDYELLVLDTCEHVIAAAAALAEAVVRAGSAVRIRLKAQNVDRGANALCLNAIYRHSLENDVP
jgi:DNA-binding winged helix-turn-helix (wHTH) protein